MNARAVGPALLLAALIPATARAGEPIRVMAASSLKELVTEATAGWSRASGAGTTAQFEASSTLARQIRQGAPCDLFITADLRWLQDLAILARYDWLGNRLAVVVPRDAPTLGLAKTRTLALAGEQVPAGIYARAALRRLGIPLPGRVLIGSSVRDVLAKVAEGGAEAGIVYTTDVAIEPRLRVSEVLPAESHPPIVYVVALLTEAGRPLSEALREPGVREAARRLGFGELP